MKIIKNKARLGCLNMNLIIYQGKFAVYEMSRDIYHRYKCHSRGSDPFDDTQGRAEHCRMRENLIPDQVEDNRSIVLSV